MTTRRSGAADPVLAFWVCLSLAALAASLVLFILHARDEARLEAEKAAQVEKEER